MSKIQFDMEKLGQLLNGWNKKDGTATEYKSADSNYRTYKPTISTTPQGGLFISTKLDHIRGFAADDHAQLEMEFAPNGIIVSTRTLMTIQGHSTLDTGLIASAAGVSGSLIGTPAIGAAAAAIAELSGKIINSLFTFITNISETGGRANFPAVVRLNMNDIFASVLVVDSNISDNDGFTKFNYSEFIARFMASNTYAQKANKVYGSILIKNEAADWKDILASDLGNPQTPEDRFRAVNAYASKNGYIGAVPNFFEADHGQGKVYGTLLIKNQAADWKDILASDLGNPLTLEDRFRAVNTYASKNGYIGAVPNFFEADNGQGKVYGTILIKKEAADWKDLLASDLGNPPMPDDRFRAVNTYASKNGYIGAFPNFFEANYDYIGAFPNFFEADYGQGKVYGTILIKKEAADWKDILASDLGNPQTPEDRFRAVNSYASKNGYIGAIPNFFEADNGQGKVYGTLLIKNVAADWKDLLASDLGNPQMPDERFRTVNAYASKNGYIGAFPNFFEADHGQGKVYGTLLIKKESADWRDVLAAEIGL